MEGLLGLIPLLIIGLIIYLLISSSKKKKRLRLESIQKANNEVIDYFNNIHQLKRIPLITPSILLKKGEEAYLESPVRLYEMKTIRKSTRGGGAIRVARGIYIGGSNGISRSHNEFTEIDSGKLVLTNQRLVFDGETSTRSVKFEKVISSTLYTDGIEVSIEGKDKGQTYVGMNNPVLWNSLIIFIHQLPQAGEIDNFAAMVARSFSK